MTASVKTIWTASLLLMGAGGSAIAGQSAATAETPAVRLEPHEGKTQFLLGDPIRLDLVFTRQEPGYAVNVSPYTYLPIPDQVDVRPAEGWSRSRRPVAEGLMDTPVPAESEPVRVPVLLNRLITFKQPGRYTVTVKTERLIPPGMMNAAPQDALITNPTEIKVRLRSEAEESAMVRKLYPELAGGRKEVQRPKVANIELLPPEQLVQLMNELVAKEEKARSNRLEMAWELAFLPGDDAMRARVALIAAYKDNGGGDPIEPLMVQGLPSSRDLKLQAQLLDAAWRDPSRVPTELLGTALRQGRELLIGPTVAETQISFRVLGDPVARAKMEAEQSAIRKEQQNEFQELVGTLSQRDEANRDKTICFLRMRGIAEDGSPQKPARCDAK